MKFQLSPATGCAGSYLKEASVEGRSGGLQAAVHRAKGSKEEDFGLEAKATFANEVSGYPRPRLQTAGSYRKETLDRVPGNRAVVRLSPAFVVLDGRNSGSYC